MLTYHQYLDSIDAPTMWEFIEKGMDTKIACPKLSTHKKVKKLLNYLEDKYPNDENFIITDWIKSMDARHLVTDYPNFTETWWSYSPLIDLVVTDQNIKNLILPLNSLSIEAKMDSIIMLLTIRQYSTFNKYAEPIQQMAPNLFENQIELSISKEEQTKLSLSKKIKFLSFLSPETVKKYIATWYGIKDVTFMLCEGLNAYPDKINERSEWLHSFIKIHSHKSQKVTYDEQFNDITFVY